jgi:hypothetical protein
MEASQPSPGLLAPYVSAAAHQILNGEPLTPRSRWALESAIDQLTAQCEARTNAETDDWRGAAALAAAVEGRSNQLADLALSVGRDGGADTDRDQVAGELTEVIDDLQSLAYGEGDRSVAARHVSCRFDAIVERLLEPNPAPPADEIRPLEGIY